MRWDSTTNLYSKAHRMNYPLMNRHIKVLSSLNTITMIVLWPNKTHGSLRIARGKLRPTQKYKQIQTKSKYLIPDIYTVHQSLNVKYGIRVLASEVLPETSRQFISSNISRISKWALSHFSQFFPYSHNARTSFMGIEFGEATPWKIPPLSVSLL